MDGSVTISLHNFIGEGIESGTLLIFKVKGQGVKFLPPKAEK
jgi:hypothetical protein